jgi:hypothetical protein
MVRSIAPVSIDNSGSSSVTASGDSAFLFPAVPPGDDDDEEEEEEEVEEVEEVEGKDDDDDDDDDDESVTLVVAKGVSVAGNFSIAALNN